MSTYSVNNIELEPVDRQPGFAAIEQSQNFAPGQLVPGVFYADIYTADGQTFIVQDTDNGLPPESGSELYMFNANILPNTNLVVKSYYKESADGPALSPQEHTVICPTGGWENQNIHLFWVEA